MSGKSGWARFTSLTTDWITAISFLAVIAVLIAGIFLSALALSYALFVLLTVVVVRSVPVEPGAWLGLRVVRRGLVIAILFILLDLLLTKTLVGPALVALILCDFALGRATRRLAGAPDDVLDERQTRWKDRGYRNAYLLFAGVASAVVLAAEFASPVTRQWLGDTLKLGGGLIAVIQLLAYLPSMMIAWSEPDRISGADAPHLRDGLGSRLARAMVGLSLIIPLLFSASIPLAPIRTVGQSQPQPGTGTEHCRYFGASKQVGIGFDATIPMSGVACWDGRVAYESWGMNAGDCMIASSVFAIVSTTECRRVTEPNGSLRFTYGAKVQAALVPFLRRDVALTLELTKDGQVVEFP